MQDKSDYYLNIARAVAQKATCMRRRYGAVIVKNDEILSTGYNGAVRGGVACLDIGECVREVLSIPPGQRYELCVSVHAEQNAIISASRQKMIGATLYLCGIDKTGDLLPRAEPCFLCRRFIINSGIQYVVMSGIAGNKTVTVEELLAMETKQRRNIL